MGQSPELLEENPNNPETPSKVETQLPELPECPFTDVVTYVGTARLMVQSRAF